jgi:hypothetical protein
MLSPLAFFNALWMMHVQWHARDLLINAVLAPRVTPAEVIAMVTGEDDEGVVGLDFAAMMIEQVADCWSSLVRAA